MLRTRLFRQFPAAQFLLLLAGLLTLVGCRQEPEIVTPIRAVKYERIEPSAEHLRRTLSGIVQSADSSSLSFQLSGTVASVNVKNGEKVTRGQILASLDPRDFELALESTQAELDGKVADAREKKAIYLRSESLYQKQLISRAQFEADQAQYENAQSSVRVNQTRLENARRDLAHTRLVAPFDGVVASRSIDAFTEVNAGSVAFVVQAPNKLEVKVLVPETLIRHINFGQAVEINFPTLQGAQVEGVVSEISSQVETGNAFRVMVTINDADVDIRTGMTASTTFLFDSPNAARILLPISALFSPGTNYGPSDDIAKAVMVFNSQTSRLEQRAVEVGEAVGSRLQVTSGLEAGDIVVVAGVAYLQDGQQVKLWEPR